MNEFKHEIENEAFILGTSKVYLDVSNKAYLLQVRFEKLKETNLIFGVIYYSNNIDNAYFSANWSKEKNYIIEIHVNTRLSLFDIEIIKCGASRVASHQFVNIDIKNILNNLFNKHVPEISNVYEVNLNNIVDDLDVY